MRLKKIKIVNYKNIKSMSKEFDGNVFVVLGDNEQGKTTFCRSFLKLITKIDKPEVPVTIGESNGTIEGVFTDDKGGKYTVILDFSNDRESIRMIVPEGISTNKISDIRNLFGYHYVDVDEFIAWSSTAEGRRKQRDTVLGMLEIMSRDAFLRLEHDEQETYKKRREANRDTEYLKSVYDAAIISEDDRQNVERTEAIRTNYLNTKELYEKSATLAGKVEVIDVQIQESEKELTRLGEEITKSIAREQSRAAQVEKEIEDLEQQIKSKKAFLKEIHDEAGIERNQMEGAVKETQKDLDNLVEEKSKLPGRNIDDLKNNLKVAEEAYDKVKNSLKAKEEMNEKFKKYEKALEASTNLDTTLTQLREQKEKIILESNFPVKGLSITEDGITLNGLPFTKEQLSTSQIMTTVFQIMVALNKKTPIFYLGRAESLGKAKLDELVKVAVENNYQIFLDKVESGEELKIEMYEDLNTNPQQSLL